MQLAMWVAGRFKAGPVPFNAPTRESATEFGLLLTNLTTGKLAGFEGKMHREALKAYFPAKELKKLEGWKVRLLWPACKEQVVVACVSSSWLQPYCPCRWLHWSSTYQSGTR